MSSSLGLVGLPSELLASIAFEVQRQSWLSFFAFVLRTCKGLKLRLTSASGLKSLHFPISASSYAISWRSVIHFFPNLRSFSIEYARSPPTFDSYLNYQDLRIFPYKRLQTLRLNCTRAFQAFIKKLTADELPYPDAIIYQNKPYKVMTFDTLFPELVDLEVTNTQPNDLDSSFIPLLEYWILRLPRHLETLSLSTALISPTQIALANMPPCLITFTWRGPDVVGDSFAHLPSSLQHFHWIQKDWHMINPSMIESLPTGLKSFQYVGRAWTDELVGKLPRRLTHFQLGHNSTASNRDATMVGPYIPTDALLLSLPPTLLQLDINQTRTKLPPRVYDFLPRTLTHLHWYIAPTPNERSELPITLTHLCISPVKGATIRLNFPAALKTIQVHQASIDTEFLTGLPARLTCLHIIGTTLAADKYSILPRTILDLRILNANFDDSSVTALPPQLTSLIFVHKADIESRLHLTDTSLQLLPRSLTKFQVCAFIVITAGLLPPDANTWDETSALTTCQSALPPTAAVSFNLPRQCCPWDKPAVSSPLNQLPPNITSLYVESRNFKFPTEPNMKIQKLVLGSLVDFVRGKYPYLTSLTILRRIELGRLVDSVLPNSLTFLSAPQSFATNSKMRFPPNLKHVVLHEFSWSFGKNVLQTSQIETVTFSDMWRVAESHIRALPNSVTQLNLEPEHLGYKPEENNIDNFRKQDIILYTLPPSVNILRISSICRVTDVAVSAVSSQLKELTVGLIVITMMPTFPANITKISVKEIIEAFQAQHSHIRFKVRNFVIDLDGKYPITLPSTLVSFEYPSPTDAIGEEFVKQLPRQLEHLAVISAHHIPHKAMHNLPPTLTSLCISCVNIFESHFPLLPTTITYLELYDGVHTMAKLLPPCLESLLLKRSNHNLSQSKITDTYIEHLPRTITNLRILMELSVTDACVPLLPPKLRSLNMRDTDFSLATIPLFPDSLTHVCLIEQPRLSSMIMHRYATAESPQRAGP